KWEKWIGGTDHDRGFGAVQSSDGGYVVVGRTFSLGAGSSDIFIIKLKPDGDVEWSTTYGSRLVDHSYAVRETSDGGFVIAGSAVADGADDTDGYLLKVNSAGAFQWQQFFG